MDSRATKFVQMMTLGWHLTFLRQDQICVPMHLSGENVEKSFSQNVLKTNGWNLQWVIKVEEHLSIAKILSPGGYLSLPLDNIHL